MEDLEKKETIKPAWLRKLEEESWQAELVVSGVAIFGSLQLPGFMDWLAEALYGWFSGEVNFVLYLFFMYSYVMAYALIVSFIVHFVLRAFWIGVVGLNSVFPKGINSEKSNYPKDFVERFKKRYEYDQSIIQKLDDLCSMLFAGCAYFVLIFFVIDIDLFIGLGVWQLLCLFIPKYLATGIVKYTVQFFLFFSLLALVLNIKWLRGTAFAKRFHYPAFILGNKPLMHVFFRPAYHLGFIFMTNLNLKKYYIWTISFMLIVLIMAMTNLINSKAIFFVSQDAYEGIYNRSDRQRAENYENLRQPEHGRIISPVIESDRISGQNMRVFIPVMRNESELQNAVCGVYEEPEGKTKDEERILKRKHFTECLPQYHRIYVNDSLYVPEIKKFNHEIKDEDGILTYLPTDNFKNGINVLKVEKWSTDTIYQTSQIPFFFEKNSH